MENFDVYTDVYTKLLYLKIGLYLKIENVKVFYINEKSASKYLYKRKAFYIICISQSVRLTGLNERAEEASKLIEEGGAYYMTQVVASPPNEAVRL